MIKHLQGTFPLVCAVILACQVLLTRLPAQNTPPKHPRLLTRHTTTTTPPPTPRPASHRAQHAMLLHVRQRLAWERPGHCTPDIDRPVRHTPCTFLRNHAPTPAFCPTPCPPTLADLRRGCQASLAIEASMENDGTCVRGNARKICMSVDARADVHMQYFSYADFRIDSTPAPAPAMLGFLASFVSNCRAWRQNFLRALTAAVHRRSNMSEVHHYGHCLRNAHSPYTARGKYKEKDALALQHRYVFSFENSETPGYVTEKLFYMLSAGAVPVYRGASDVRRMLPASDAAVVVASDRTPDEVAELLLRENATQYAARRAWRVEAWQPKFLANLDYAVWHSTCRACVRVRSMEVGLKERGVWVREQGFVEFAEVPARCAEGDMVAWLVCVGSVVEAHVPAAEKAWRPQGVGVVVQVYRAWDRAKCEIVAMEDVWGLPAGSELEVVMENPGWLRRRAMS